MNFVFIYNYEFRESQMRRKEEYEKELEEIMQRVSKQTLLLERITKVSLFFSCKNLFNNNKSNLCN